jgi:hypothetical protein
LSRRFPVALVVALAATLAPAAVLGATSIVPVCRRTCSNGWRTATGPTRVSS